jgi:hypothetical protein
MDKMITEGKKSFPNCFIKTKVDVDNLTVEAHAKTKEGWIDLGLKSKIPLTILDNVNLVSSQVTSQVISQAPSQATSQSEGMIIS